jgi:hypothetical protein
MRTTHAGLALDLAGRDVVLQFDGERMNRALDILPELDEIRPLMQEAARGIEFTGRTTGSAPPAGQ